MYRNDSQEDISNLNDNVTSPDETRDHEHEHDHHHHDEFSEEMPCMQFCPMMHCCPMMMHETMPSKMYLKQMSHKDDDDDDEYRQRPRRPRRPRPYYYPYFYPFYYPYYYPFYNGGFYKRPWWMREDYDDDLDD